MSKCKLPGCDEWSSGGYCCELHQLYADNDRLKDDNQRMIDMAGEAIGTDPSLRTSACVEVLVQRCDALRAEKATWDKVVENYERELAECKATDIAKLRAEVERLRGLYTASCDREFSLRAHLRTLSGYVTVDSATEATGG